MGALEIVLILIIIIMKWREWMLFGYWHWISRACSEFVIRLFNIAQWSVCWQLWPEQKGSLPVIAWGYYCYCYYEMMPLMKDDE